MRQWRIRGLRALASAIGVLASILGGYAAMAQVAGPVAVDGASFSEPDGWVRLPVGRSKTKGWFVPRGSDAGNAKKAVMVDIGTPTQADARKTAEGLAKNWGGRVLDETTTLDGIEALRVRAEPKADRLQPVEGIVAFRKGRLYLLMGGAVKGGSVIDDVETVRKAWKWTD